MDASYLSFLHTNNFPCVFRYYYGVNTNTSGYFQNYDTMFDSVHPFSSNLYPANIFCVMKMFSAFYVSLAAYIQVHIRML